MKRLVISMAASALVVGTALAAKEPPREAPGRQPAYTADKSVVTEGFEGAFPPSGWTPGVTDTRHTWIRDTLAPYAGLAAAKVSWQTGVRQDESLSFVWPVGAGEDLFFATQGSTYWTAHADFTVEVNGIRVYSFRYDNAGTSWRWEYVQIDLAPWEGTTPTFTFRYAGDDGADHYLDAVRIGAYTPPPPPSPVSFCAEVDQGFGTHFAGSTCDGSNRLSLLGCAAYAENGLEHYYEIQVPGGCYFTANVSYANADGALWLLDSCEAPGGAFGCLGYADATLGNGPESLSYQNTTGSLQIVYLVVDSWGTDSCGSYTFDFVSDCAVSIEQESFGSVKAMFR